MTSLLLVLLNGVITDDFLVDEDSVKGYQVAPVVAVAPDGSFAVAWEDSLLQDSPLYAKGDVYIRFFDEVGTPITGPLKLNEDSIAAFPRLCVNDSGRFMCVWTEAQEPFYWSLYARLFDSTGEPASERYKVQDAIFQRLRHDVASSSAQDFFVGSSDGNSILGRRYDKTGSLIGQCITIHSSNDPLLKSVSVDANSSEAAALVWDTTFATRLREIRYQIVDSLNNLVLDTSHQVTDWGGNWLHRKPRVRWLDDDRFVIFWLKTANADWDMIRGVQGKLFDAEGDSLSEIRTLIDDPNAAAIYVHDPLSISSLHGGLFAGAYERGFDGPGFRYSVAVGFIADTLLNKTAGIFRLASSEPHYYQQEDSPCVDANADRIVWVWQDNSRMREHGDPEPLDPYFSDIHCKITDWDLTVITESPAIENARVELITPIGSEIVLRYSDCPEGFHANVYDAAGRRIDELHSSQASGTITWGEGYGPGVYFVRELSRGTSHRVVIIE